MHERELFRQALGLTPPWEVRDVSFDPDRGRLELRLDFPKGSTFRCPECGREECPAYDTTTKRWRHLDFFEHDTILEARVPRVECAECGVKQVEVPWARKQSGFTLLFEAYLLLLCREMPVNAVARRVGETDTRLWRVLHHYVGQAREQADFSGVRQVAMDETASRRGHNYISLFLDSEERRVLYATEGRDAGVLAAFRRDLERHGGKAEQVEEFCLDMSGAYLKGLAEEFPEAEVTFDKFHVMKLLNGAVDEVRRQEQKGRPELKKTRYLWLKNPENLTAKQRARLEEIRPSRSHLKTALAYRIKRSFQEFWEQPTDLAEAFLTRWYYWATHSQLEPVIRVAKTIKEHWAGVLRWHTTRVTNGVLEGLNSLIQAAKAKARGYRSTRNLIVMTYLIGGKLDFPLPELTHSK